MERLPIREIIALGSTIGLIPLAFCAFSSATKQRILDNYDGKCPDNGRSRGLQIHHRVEQCMGGSDNEVNGVPLTHDVHAYWDAHTQETGEVYPGIPINECPPEMFRNETARQRIIYKYEHGEPLVEHLANHVVKSIRRHHERVHKHKEKRKKYRGQGKRH